MLQIIRRSAPFFLLALASCGPAREFEENAEYSDTSEAIVIDTTDLPIPTVVARILGFLGPKRCV